MQRKQLSVWLRKTLKVINGAASRVPAKGVSYALRYIPIDQKSSERPVSSLEPLGRPDCPFPDHRGKCKSSPHSVPSALERWGLTLKVFERCRQQGLKAPTLDQFEQMHAGSTVPPYND